MEYKDLPNHQKRLIIHCVCKDDVSELQPGEWAELVRIAETDADFRSACLTLESGDQFGLLHLLQSTCRSVNCKIKSHSWLTASRRPEDGCGHPGVTGDREDRHAPGVAGARATSGAGQALQAA
jgi:hypothetical protein